MGQDYQICEVHDVCSVTGWPRDKHGHILDASENLEHRATGWQGMKLPELTYPYGSLEYAAGSGDDFYCFAYSIIDGSTLDGSWLVLHSTINSETGAFIQDGDYKIVPMYEYDREELAVVSEALDWCADNDVKHDKRGWNQDPYYFARSVYLDILKRRGDFYLKFSERERRFGGKRINKLIGV